MFNGPDKGVGGLPVEEGFWERVEMIKKPVSNSSA